MITASTRGLAGAALTGALLVGLSACSDDDPAGALDPVSPTTAVPTATASPTASATATPTTTPSPTAPVLSRFEADPAVQGLRAYFRGSALALNAKNAALPAYVASTTARQRQRFPTQLRSNQGYLPGPAPMTPLAVRATSATSKAITGCILDSGWTLDRKGGTPLRSRAVLATEVSMVRQAGVWKVDGFAETDRVSCSGVRPVEVRF